MLEYRQLQDIENLQKEVEANDGLQLKLNWEMLRNRDSKQLDFFKYENGKLVAFLGVYAFGSTAEVTGMVKPSERRKGHFTQLFSAAVDVARKNGYKKILLNAPASSEAAKVFLSRHGASYGFTEHQMEWQPRELEEVEAITLRQATANDIDMRVRLDMEAFNLSEEDAIATNRRVDGDEDTDILMIIVDEETVGKIRVKREDGQAWIYGFSILPGNQGKGIGRRVLRKVVKQESEAGLSVHLEVETKNANALNLYQTVGFKAVHAQDYYTYK
jgi:ribosomal protein S18 acetylase RimI-like enzyme